jgi:hypothetical protein
VAKRLTTACVVRLIGIANETRDQQAARLMRMVPGKIASAEDAGIVSIEKRHKARKILIREYQRQRQQIEQQAANQVGLRFWAHYETPPLSFGGIDPLLMQAVKDWGARLFAERQTIQALEYFLGERKRAGKHAKPETAERDFEIALAIVRKMGLATDPKSERMTLDDAANAVATERGQRGSADSFANIYKRYRIAARAAFFLERDRIVSGPDPLADILPD